MKYEGEEESTPLLLNKNTTVQTVEKTIDPSILNTTDKSKDNLDRFTQEYSISWISELRQTLLMTLAVAILCLFIFAISFFFTPDPSKLDPRLERIFKESISAETCSKNLKFLTKEPHMAGTNSSNNLALELKKKLDEYLGSYATSKLVQYDVLLSYPTTDSKIELLENGVSIHKANLFEDPIKEDEQSQINPDLVRAHLAYSPNGTVTGPIYYVNFGRPEDFELITKQGINLKDSIVITRYGKIFRGIKAQLAEKYGAKGIIIYSDPEQDGYVNGNVYPDGPNRPESGLQRGSLMYPTYSGDPLTPNGPSIPGTLNRIKREDAINLPQKIVVLPMSHRDAKQFLSKLEGPEVPSHWRGGIKGITYRFGDKNSTITAYMNVKNIESIKPIYNVISTIKGSIEPDRSVIIGNHRDAWVYGAADPHTGTVAMLEVAKGIGQMLKNRWKPRRSIIFASWDAEEYGLIGSVEWVEQYSEILKKEAVAYLNVDTSDGIYFNVESSPALSQVIRDESTKVVSPEQRNLTLDQTWDKNTSYVGDGSDYSPFFHHLGVPIIAMDFVSGGSYGAYHSIYDSYKYVSEIIDKDMQVCQSLSHILGLVLIRLSNDAVLPFKTQEQGTTMIEYYKELFYTKDYLEFTASLNEDQRRVFSTSLNQLNQTILNFEKISIDFDKKFNNLPTTKDLPLKLRTFNDKAMLFERGFTRKEGIKSRPWYKHVICSPGADLGYDYEVFPSLMESMRKKDLTESLMSIEQIIEAIKSASSILQE